MFQAQVVEDVVVTGVVVVADRCVQLTLCIEHVDDVAGPHLITDLCGFQRALVGDDRLFARLHLLDISVHRAVQVAGVFHHLAAQAFTLLFALTEAGISLADLRTGQPAAVDRDVHLQADGALLDAAVETLTGVVGVGEAQRVIVAFLVLRHRIDGGCVACLALTQGFFRGADGVVAGQQIQVLLGCGVNPGFRVVGCGREHRQGVHDAFDGVVIAVGQGDQRLKGVIDLALGDDPRSASGVVASLRLKHIGLVRQADIEAFIGLIELALERRFFRLRRGQIVLRAEYGKIVLGALQNKILLGGRELQDGLLVDVLRGFELEPAVSAEDRLTQRRAINRSTAADDGRGLVDRCAGVIDVGATGDVRQQAGACLRHDFLLRVVAGAGCRQVGVIVDRFLIHTDQTGPGGQRHVCCPGHRTRSTRHGNGQ